MFERLFGSRTRVKILKLFLLHQNDQLSLSQIIKVLKIQIIPLKKELDNLEKLGLITTGMSPVPENPVEKGKTEEQKQEKYYQANLNFILFDELKALILKGQVLYERDFIDKLLKLGKIKLLVLTGIFVNREDSPIDLLIVGHLNKQKLLRLLKELENELGREINFTYMETSEFIYRRNITDVFLYEVLEGRKIVIIDELNA